MITEDQLQLIEHRIRRAEERLSYTKGNNLQRILDVRNLINEVRRLNVELKKYKTVDETTNAIIAVAEAQNRK